MTTSDTSTDTDAAIPCTPSYPDATGDMDGDGQPDECDEDIDGDGWSNQVDNCERTYNRNQDDSDYDGYGDVCDEDIDGDFVDNDEDNCPEVENRDQADFDGDGIGDPCDSDRDGDGVEQPEDVCPDIPNADQKDRDDDGVGDVCDSQYLVGGSDAAVSTADGSYFVASHVDAAGDLNADGVEDFIVTTEGFKNVLSRVFVFFGSSTRRMDFSPSTADIEVVRAGADVDNHDVAVGVGDVNGDGVDDFAVADASDKTGQSGPDVFLFFGSTSLSGRVALTDADATWSSEAPDDLKGLTLAAAGDVNGDGLDDFLIGAPREYLGTVQGKDFHSALYLVYGRAQFAASNMLADADVIVRSSRVWDYLMQEFAGVGDLNGDGYDDFAVGVPVTPAFRAEPGRVHVFLGGNLDAPEMNPSDSHAVLIGEHFEDRTGTALSTGGDLDGDGMDDLLVGANLNEQLGPESGKVYVVRGQSAFPSTVQLDSAPNWLASSQGARFGTHVDFVGDLNGDGHDDFLVGEPNRSTSTEEAVGSVYMYYGGPLPATPPVPADSEIRFDGHRRFGGVGYDFDGGDFDGDGRVDILLPGQPVDSDYIQESDVFLYYGPIR